MNTNKTEQRADGNVATIEKPAVMPEVRVPDPSSRLADNWEFRAAQCTEKQARIFPEYVAFAASPTGREDATNVIMSAARNGDLVNEKGNNPKWNALPGHATLRFIGTCGAGWRGAPNTRMVRAAAQYMGDILKKEDAAEQNTPEGIARRNNVATAFGLPTRRVSVNGGKSTAVQMNPVVSIQGTRIVIETANMDTVNLQNLEDFGDMAAHFYLKTVQEAEVNRIAAAKTAAKEAAKATFNSLTDDEKAAFIKELMG